MTAEDRVADLEHRLGIVEDVLAIRNLQHSYGYYLDKCLYEEVVDLFDDDGEVIFIGGVYKGKKGAARLYAGRFRNNFANGKNGPFRQWWEGGLYENVYTRTDGIWKIKRLFYRAFWHGTFEDGWAHTPPEYVPNASVTYPDDPYGPDEILANAPQLWPDTTTFPFHYRHPVTGKEVTPGPAT
jgi:hypothetical protein